MQIKFNKIIIKLKKFLVLFLSFTLTGGPFLINAAYALQNDIAVDANAPAAYQPHLKSSANGTDVIDATKPIASGSELVSINHMEKLNNTEGLIFNNSQYDGNSRIGGFVEANVNMNQPGDNAASVIIGQVNGLSRSNFTNVTEVFGSQAKLLISNPNGVTCNGCSFIGAPKVTLTTGLPIYNSLGGSWNGMIDVNKGDVEIGNNGFLGTDLGGDPTKTVNYADIIARAVKITGELSAKNEVNIITGRNNYNYNNGTYTKKSDDGSTKPLLAIDASILGSITSGRIMLIATEDGIGVKSLSNVTSNASDIIITSDGEAHIRNLYSARDAIITSNNYDIDAGDIAVARDAILSAKTNIAINGNITATQDLRLTATNNNININSNLTSGRDIFLTAGNNIYNSAIINAAYDIEAIAHGNNDPLSSTEKGLINSGTFEAGNNLTIKDTYNFTNKNGGKLTSTLGNILITLENDFINQNSASIKANNLLKITAHNLTNSSTQKIESAGNIELYLTNLLTNSSEIKAGNDLIIKKNETSEDNIITFDNSGNLNVGRNLKINANTITSSTAIAALSDIEIQTTDYINNVLIQAGRNLLMNLTGLFTNNSSARVHAVGLLHITADRIDNKGMIDSGGNLRIKATSGIDNSGLIYSGNEMSLWTKTILNNTNNIYSVGKMRLGDVEIDKKMIIDLNSGANVSGVADLDRTDTINNIAGTIESVYDGIDPAYNSADPNDPNNSDYVSLYMNAINLYNKRLPVDTGPNPDVESSNAAVLKSAGHMRLNVDNIINEASEITSGKDMTIIGLTLQNNYHDLVNDQSYGYTVCSRRVLGRCVAHNSIWVPVFYHSYTIPTIHAGGKIDITLSGQTTTTSTANNPSGIAGLINNGEIFGAQAVNITSAQTVLNSGLQNVAIQTYDIDSSKFTPKVDGVVTRINVNNTADAVDPSYKFYLVNTIYTFDPSKYAAQSRVINSIRKATGGANKSLIDSCIAGGGTVDYCINLNTITIDNSKQFIIKTDPKTENDIIAQAALSIGKFSFTGANTSEQDRINLYNNSAEFAVLNTNINLEFGKPLTKSQQAKLTKPIVWYEEQQQDGVIMLVAKVYLPNNYYDNTKKGTGGVIASNANISVLSQYGDIVNSGGKITGNNINIAANNGNIINSAAKYTNNIDGTRNSGNITEYITSDAEVKAAGNLTLTALKNITVTGAELSSTGNTNITAENFTLEAIALRNRTESSWGNKKKGGYSISDETTNVGSNLNVGGNLVINTTNDVNIKGSDASAGGNLTLTAGNEVNISAAQNLSYSESGSHKQGMTVSKSSISVNDKLTNIASNLTAVGNVSIISGADTNLIGAKIKGSNVDVTAGKELNVYAVADTNYSYSATSKSKNYSKIVNFALPVLKPLAKLSESVPTPVSGAIIGANALAQGDVSSKFASNTRDKLTNVGSTITANGNVNLTSQNNLTLIGSNFSGSAGNLRSNAGDVSIYNTVDRDYSHSESSSSKLTLSSVGASAVQGIAAGQSNYMTNQNMFKTPSQKQDTYNKNAEDSKNVPQKGETHIATTQDETVVASKLNFNNLTINSNNDTNIRSSDITSQNNTNITSGNNTNITTAVENHYSYKYDSKKTPKMMAAMSNSISKAANDMMPSIGHKNSDNTQSNNQVKELVYNQRNNKVETTTKTNVASNITATNNATITSQNNNLISGSNLSAGNNINIAATNGQNIITAALDQATTSTSSTKQNYANTKLNYERGRESVNSNSKVVEETTTTNTSTQKQSNITASNNVTVASKGDTNILASNVSAGNDAEITSTNGNVNILALKNTTTTTSQTKQGTLSLSAGVGNSHVDTAYAADDLAKAAEDLKHAKDNLSKMQDLHKEGKAESDAVDDAKTNLALALLNYDLAGLKLAAAAAKSAASVDSLWTGFYGDLRLSIAGQKTNSSDNIVTNIASNVTSGNNILINSGSSLISSDPTIIDGTKGNTTITGSNIKSDNGNIDINSKNNTNIIASQDTYNQSTKSKTWEENLTLASSAGSGTAVVLDNAINALALSMGMSKSNSDTSSTTNNNSQLIAQNGAINITSTINDTNIKGANILARDTTITSGKNLNVESLQNTYKQKDKSFGMNLGGGVKGNSGSAGINYSTNKTNRSWVDNQTTVIGENSVTINTGNNTNLKGALIANIKADGTDGANLALNTKTLTTSDIQDSETNQSSGQSLSTNIGKGSAISDPSASNPGQQINYFPNGSTTIAANNSGYIKEQITKATIGNGVINITDSTNPINTKPETINRDIARRQEITKDTITNALDVKTTIDNRLFTDKGREQMGLEVLHAPSNIKKELKFDASLPTEIPAEVVSVAIKVYDKMYPSGISDPGIRDEIRTAIRQAALTGDIETLKVKIKQLTDKTPSGGDLDAIINLSEKRNFAKLQDDIGPISYNRFLDKYTSQTGIFFDGTDNDMNRDYNEDPKLNKETNVARMDKIYLTENGKGEKIYIAGIGTSGESSDPICKGLGCGIENNQLEAKKNLLDKTINNEINKSYLFFPIDVVDFSRGATTGADFINKIDNENYWNLGLLTRSHLMFDPVASYVVPGTGIDVNRDFSTPKNIIAIQINAKDESRNLFDLQSLYTSTGQNPSPNNWKQITLPGSHSNIGGGLPDGYQGKTQDMAFYSMQTMINEAQKYGIKFGEIPENQRPSQEFNQLMTKYNQAQINLQNDPSQKNKTYFNSISGFINDIAIHDSTLKGTGELYNYSIGNQRGTYYPNDKYLKEPINSQPQSNK